ncbi:MAG: SprT-like domain-containing protein [Planctomycetota bacterium]
MSSVEELELPGNDRLRARAAELFRLWRVLDTDVDVRWNARLSTTAGQAYVQSGRIELNPRLLARWPDRIDGVLVHEAAHVAAFRLFGEHAQAHGRHWRSLMRLAGLPPDITHDMPVDDLRRSRRKSKPTTSRAAAKSRPYIYLRLCGACGDRVVVRAVRYGRCHGCGARGGEYLVVKTRDTQAGRLALERMTEQQVRARFA